MWGLGLGLRVWGSGFRVEGLGVCSPSLSGIRVLLVLSRSRGPQYRPRKTKVLLLSTPHKEGGP